MQVGKICFSFIELSGTVSGESETGIPSQRYESFHSKWFYSLTSCQRENPESTRDRTQDPGAVPLLPSEENTLSLFKLCSALGSFFIITINSAVQTSRTECCKAYVHSKMIKATNTMRSGEEK